MAHSRPASNTGPRQVEIFEEEGVDLNKVQIAHCGDTDDLDYIEGLIEKGVWIGLDRYGLELFLPYDRRQATAKELLERGYADRIFLSADSVRDTDWFPGNVIEQLVRRVWPRTGRSGSCPRSVLPELREAGHDRGAGADDDGRQRRSLADRTKPSADKSQPMADANDPGLLSAAESSLLVDQYEITMARSYHRLDMNEPVGLRAVHAEGCRRTATGCLSAGSARP